MISAYPYTPVSYLYLLSFRLRQKIRVPYRTLEGHVSRLHRLQLASDVLRRTARFVMVARRLEFQMGEVNQATNPGASENGNKPNVNGGIAKTISDDDHEGEKERNLAKAALSIAELGELFSLTRTL